jgi:hypothetical protein
MKYNTTDIPRPEYFEYIILNQESFNQEYIERDIHSIYGPNTYDGYFLMRDTYLEIHTNSRPYSEYAKLKYAMAQHAILDITTGEFDCNDIIDDYLEYGEIQY